MDFCIFGLISRRNGLTHQGKVRVETCNALLKEYKDKRCTCLYRLYAREDEGFLDINICEHVRMIVKVEMGNNINMNEIIYKYKELDDMNECLLIKCLDECAVLHNDYNVTYIGGMEPGIVSYIYEASSDRVYERDLASFKEEADLFLMAANLFEF